jgi:PadR family transcriptional regulator, regulatory protein PadR
MTPSTRTVLEVLLAAGDEVFGLEIVRSSRLGAGTIYPILQRLLHAGWVTAEWEDSDLAHSEARPPRRYYRLTGLGQARAVHALDAAARGSARRAVLGTGQAIRRPGLTEGAP